MLKKNKIKVIYLTNWYNSIYNNIFNNLDKNIEITMLLSSKFSKISDNYHKPKSIKYKIKILSVKDFGNYIYFWKKENDNFLLWYKKDLKKFISSEKPDLVITNLIYLPSTYQISKICKKLGIKFILQTEIKKLPTGLFEKSLFNIYSKIFSTKIIKNSNLILPWTNDSKNFIKNNYNIEKKKIKVIPPGIDTNIFYPNKNKVFLKDGILKILTIARYVSYKRYKDLVSAALLLKKKNIRFKMTFLGSGPLFIEIKNLITVNNLNDEIKLIEKIPWKNVRKLMLEHDLFTLVSYNEAIGLVVPEAMACGLPVIVSDTCGAKTYVEEGKNGLFFETGNVDEIIKKIIFLNDKNKLEKFGKESENIIKNNYDIEIIGKIYSDIIIDIINK